MTKQILMVDLAQVLSAYSVSLEFLEGELSPQFSML